MDVTGRGAPLVLVHGVGSDRSVWRMAAAPLAARRRVIVPDLPGFGASPPPPDGFTLQAVADQLAQALSARTRRPFDLVGNSLGGAIALVLARTRPELVRRLVLVAPAGLAPRPWPVAALAGRLAGPAVEIRRRVGAPLAGSGLAREALLWGTVGAPRELGAERARLMFQASRGATCCGAAVEAVLRADLRPALRTLRTPVGLIWGERDRIIPIATLAGVGSLLDGVPVERIPGAGHVPHLEQPADFLRALERVLAALEP